MYNKNSGFTLVELMVVISMVAILSAVAIPMYSNHITKTKLTNVIIELDGYKNNIRDFFISKGVTTDEDLTNFPADSLKDVYLGDSDVKIMSVENSGRILAEREISGTNYQIALTPKITNNRFDWDCTVFNATEQSAAAGRLLPNGCTGAQANQNDDQIDYTQKFNTLDEDRSNAYDTAKNDWETRTDEAINDAAADPNSEYAQALAAMDSAKTDKDNSKDSLNQANSELNSASNDASNKNYALNNANNDVTSQNTTLNNAQSAEATALSNKNQADTDFTNGTITEAQRDAAHDSYDTAVANTSIANTNHNTAVSNQATAQTNYDSSITARNIAQTNQSTTNTNYNNDYATYSSSVDNVNSQYRSIQDSSKNTDSGSFSTDVSNANSTFTSNVNNNNSMNQYQRTTSTENPDNHIVDPDSTWQSQHYDNNNFSTQSKDSK